VVIGFPFGLDVRRSDLPTFCFQTQNSGDRGAAANLDLDAYFSTVKFSFDGRELE
jgi:hypothetical protein